MCESTFDKSLDGNRVFTILIEFFPDRRIIPIAPIPCGVDCATIVSFSFIKSKITKTEVISTNYKLFVFYPNATSSDIITINPTITPIVAKSTFPPL